MLQFLEKASSVHPLLDMTLTGIVIILFVLLARLCLKKAPKIYPTCSLGSRA